MHGVNQILAKMQSPEASTLHFFCINEIVFLAQLEERKNTHQAQPPESNVIWTINPIDSKLFLGCFDKVLSRSSKIYVMKGVKLPLLQWDVFSLSFLSFFYYTISDGYNWNPAFHIYTLEKSVKTGPSVLCWYEGIFSIDFSTMVLPLFWIMYCIVLYFGKCP